MAKLTAGILGPLSGKVAGVVGSSWNGVNYVRGYAIPSASNTAAQELQRTKFSVAVAAAKPFVGPVFNQHYDKFLSKMSGYNKFVSENVANVNGENELELPRVTAGPLYPGSSPAGTYITGTGTVTVEWSTENGVDGSGTDTAVFWMRDKSTNDVVFGTPVTRTVGTGVVTSASFVGRTLADLEAGVYFVKMNGSLVSKISTNLSCVCTD